MECLDRVLDLPGRLPAGPLRKRPDVGGLRSKDPSDTDGVVTFAML